MEKDFKNIKKKIINWKKLKNGSGLQNNFIKLISDAEVEGEGFEALDKKIYIALEKLKLIEYNSPFKK